MSHDIQTSIEQYFAANEDGEFLSPGPADPYWLIGPADYSRTIVYATKSGLARAFEDAAIAEGLAIVGRYGLPARRDINWLRNLLGPQRLLFCGDLDPPDLLIFAWLRAALGPNRIEHYAIDDRLLAALGDRLPDSFRVPLAPSEIAALGLLSSVLPDWRSLVGPACSQWLDAGLKIEIEAVISLKESAAEVLRPALRNS